MRQYGTFLLRFLCVCLVVLVAHEVGAVTWTLHVHNNSPVTITSGSIRFGSSEATATSSNPTWTPADVDIPSGGTETFTKFDASDLDHQTNKWWTCVGLSNGVSRATAAVYGTPNGGTVAWEEHLYFGSSEGNVTNWYLNVKIKNNTGTTNDYEVESNFQGLGTIHTRSGVPPFGGESSLMLLQHEQTGPDNNKDAVGSRVNYVNSNEDGGISVGAKIISYVTAAHPWVTNIADVQTVVMLDGANLNGQTNEQGVTNFPATPNTNTVDYTPNEGQTNLATEGTLKTTLEIIHQDLEGFERAVVIAINSNTIATVAGNAEIVEAIEGIAGGVTNNFSTNVSDAVTHELLQNLIDQTNGAGEGTGGAPATGEGLGEQMNTNFSDFISDIEGFSAGSPGILSGIDMTIRYPNLLAQYMPDVAADRPAKKYLAGMVALDGAEWVIDCNPANNTIIAQFAGGLRNFFIWALGAMLLYANYKILEEYFKLVFHVPQVTTVSSAVPLVAETTALSMAGVITIAIGALPFVFYVWYAANSGSILSSSPVSDLRDSAPAWYIATALVDFFIPVEHLIAFITSTALFRLTCAGVYAVSASIIKWCVG